MLGQTLTSYSTTSFSSCVLKFPLMTFMNYLSPKFFGSIFTILAFSQVPSSVDGNIPSICTPPRLYYYFLFLSALHQNNFNSLLVCLLTISFLPLKSILIAAVFSWMTSIYVSLKFFFFFYKKNPKTNLASRSFTTWAQPIFLFLIPTLPTLSSRKMYLVTRLCKCSIIVLCHALAIS